jgi:hypothetical protein
MNKFKKFNVALEFEFEAVNNKTMSLTILSGNQKIEYCPDCSIVKIFEFNINLPTEILITATGKNMESDTVLENGLIIKDKHITLASMQLDNLIVPVEYLKKCISFSTEHDQQFTNYFGFNGSATLNFKKSDIFTQYCSFVKELTI